jgi:hypothetical protein
MKGRLCMEQVNNIDILEASAFNRLCDRILENPHNRLKTSTSEDGRFYHPT